MHSGWLHICAQLISHKIHQQPQTVFSDARWPGKATTVFTRATLWLCVCPCLSQAGNRAYVETVQRNELISTWLGRWTCDWKIAGSIPSLLLAGNNLQQVVHTHVPLSPSRIIRWCPAAGKVIVGLALHFMAVRHRLQIHLQAHGLRKGDEHPAYTPHGAWHTLPLPFMAHA